MNSWHHPVFFRMMASVAGSLQLIIAYLFQAFLGVKVALVLRFIVGGTGSFPGNRGEFGAIGRESFAFAAMLEEEIDHQGIPFLGGMACFAGSFAGNHGGTGIYREIGADSGDFYHAAVGDDPWIDGAMAAMEMDTGGAKAVTRIIISFTGPIGGDTGQAAAGRGMGNR